MAIRLRVLWSLLFIIMLLWQGADEFHVMKDWAETTAHANMNKDQALREWVARHGGIYVPITKDTLPNPNLDYLPERDIKTESGQKLTLLNPAYALRQISGDYGVLYGITSEITSLNPISEKNNPDEWERKALHILSNGQEEYKEYVNINHKIYLRIMRPLLIQDSCLKCHQAQGYRVGDLRGGITVSVPMSPFIREFISHTIEHILAYGFLWFLGFWGIGVASKRILASDHERESALMKVKFGEEKYKALVENTQDIIMQINASGKIGFINYVFPGSRKEDLIGKTIFNIAPKVFHPALIDALNTVFNENKPASLESKAPGPDKKLVWYKTHVAPITGVKPKAATLIARNIESQKKLEARLKRLALVDDLTHISNRRDIFRRLNDEKQRADRTDRPFAVIMIDLDYFKQVNDKFGHDAGDQVLRSLAALIQGSVRAMDSFGRLGGEEFLILLPETGASQALQKAEVLRKLVLNNSFTGEDFTLKITISAGVSVYRPNDDIKDLLARADKNLYRAKNSGRNCSVFQDD